MLDWRERDSTVWARSVLRSASGQPPFIISVSYTHLMVISEHGVRRLGSR